MGGADLSQLHAWLVIHTLTLTRQRGDTSRCCRGTTTDTLVHTHADVRTLTCACTLSLYKPISDMPMNVSVDSHIYRAQTFPSRVSAWLFSVFENVKPVIVNVSNPEENKL